MLPLTHPPFPCERRSVSELVGLSTDFELEFAEIDWDGMWPSGDAAKAGPDDVDEDCLFSPSSPPCMDSEAPAHAGETPQ